jgi:hypothetical protein
MLDFCYFVQLSCMTQYLFFPASVWFGELNFAMAMGPLAWAIPLWRNSLVFHSLDKVTSVYIHFFPSLLMFCWRWFPAEGAAYHPPLSDAIGMKACLVWPVLTYILWQLLYFVKTEVVDKDKIDNDPELSTSLRVLTGDERRAINKTVVKVCRHLRVFGKDETFDLVNKPAKAKAIYMSSQLVYTTVALLPVRFIYASYWLHVGFLVSLLCICVHNGSAYYIQVFSRQYTLQFNDEWAAPKPKREKHVEKQARGSAEAEAQPEQTKDK